MRSQATRSQRSKAGARGIINRHALPEQLRGMSRRQNGNSFRGGYITENKKQNQTHIIEKRDSFDFSDKELMNTRQSNNEDFNGLFQNIPNPLRPKHDLLKQPPVGSILNKNKDLEFNNLPSNDNISPYQESPEKAIPMNSLNLDILGNNGLKLLQLRNETKLSASGRKQSSKPQEMERKNHFHRRGVSEAQKELPSCFSPYKKEQNMSTAANTRRLNEIKVALKHKREILKEGPRNELESMIDSTMREHRKLMRIFDKKNKISKVSKILKERNKKDKNESTDEEDVVSPYTIIGSLDGRKTNQIPQKNQIMPARLIGETEELESAYQEYLIKQKELKKEEKLTRSDSESERNYHEGAIPRNRRRYDASSQGSKVSDSTNKLNKQKTSCSVQYPKSIYKYLTGNLSKDINLSKF